MSPGEVHEIDVETVARFARLVRGYAETVDGEANDLSLCRQLRGFLVDLYAAGVHTREPAHSNERSEQVELTGDERKAAIEATLEQRLPHGMYWSALLPLTYLTVGQAGVKTMAEDLQHIYSWLAPGLKAFDAAGMSPVLVDWWFGGWEVSWGSPAARCIGILHEVITDLSTNIYGESPPPR